jgi:peptide/nickel transport system permease protein
MTAYLIRRLWQMVPTMFGVVLLVFLLFKGFGGDPAEILAGQNASAAKVDAIRQQLGLNEPLWTSSASSSSRSSPSTGAQLATNESVAHHSRRACRRR